MSNSQEIAQKGPELPLLFEDDVIKKINFKDISFKIILIEHSLFNATTIKNTKKIKNLLLRENYIYVKNFGETSVYKNKLY